MSGCISPTGRERLMKSGKHTDKTDSVIVITIISVSAVCLLFTNNNECMGTAAVYNNTKWSDICYFLSMLFICSAYVTAVLGKNFSCACLPVFESFFCLIMGNGLKYSPECLGGYTWVAVHSALIGLSVLYWAILFFKKKLSFATKVYRNEFL